jgi:hypothetical protein
MWLWDPPMNGGLYRQKIAEKIDSVGKLCFATCHQRPLKVNLLRNCSIASCLLDAMVRDIIQTRGTYLRSVLAQILHWLLAGHNYSSDVS